jgi:hypothetical protein
MDRGGGTTPSSRSVRFVRSSDRASLPTSAAASAFSSHDAPKLSRFTAFLIAAPSLPAEEAIVRVRDVSAPAHVGIDRSIEEVVLVIDLGLKVWVERF